MKNKILMRINKYLANKGYGSRREVDKAIEQGIVLVNGTAAKLGDKLTGGERVDYRGKTFFYEDNEKIEKLYLAFNKPVGIVCTCSPDDPDNIIDYLKDHPENSLTKEIYEKIHLTKIYPIGRLDKNSRGLILLTNDGELTQKLTHPKYEHEKEYIVTCSHNIDDKFIKKFSTGVKIYREDSDSELVKTQECYAKKITEDQFVTILKQGYKRQIRKMVKVLGNEVTDLFRTRIASIKILDKLKPGSYIELKYSEVAALAN